MDWCESFLHKERPRTILAMPYNFMIIVSAGLAGLAHIVHTHRVVMEGPSYFALIPCSWLLLSQFYGWPHISYLTNKSTQSKVFVNRSRLKCMLNDQNPIVTNLSISCRCVSLWVCKFYLVISSVCILHAMHTPAWYWPHYLD